MLQGSLRSSAGALALGVVVLVGVAGCGSKFSGPPTTSLLPPTTVTTPIVNPGVMDGKVTFPGGKGSAIVRVFSPQGKLVAHRGVTASDPGFHFQLAAGDYQVLMRIIQTAHSGFPQCERTVASVSAHHTTHVVLGMSCSTS